MDHSVLHCAETSDIEYFQEQVLAAKDAEALWTKWKTQPLTQDESKRLSDFISTMEPKTAGGQLTDRDFKTAHAEAKSGWIKANIEAKGESSVQGNNLDSTSSSGSKRGLDSSELTTNKEKKR